MSGIVALLEPLDNTHSVAEEPAAAVQTIVPTEEEPLTSTSGTNNCVFLSGIVIFLNHENVWQRSL